MPRPFSRRHGAVSAFPACRPAIQACWGRNALEMRPSPDSAGSFCARACGNDSRVGGQMRGTMVCSVSDTEEGRGALELAAELSKRFGLRLVLAHVASGI